MNENSKHIVLSTHELEIGYKTRNNKHVVADSITIELQQGELVGVVGANGIGKSTLLRTITAVQPELAGTININQKKITEYSSIDLAKSLSVVLTDTMTSRNLTGYEVIALARHPYTNWVGTMSKEDKNHINRAIELTNCDDFVRKKCFELSDGQLQKIMIARAIAQDTDIIILDEPTTHLDMYHKAYILSLLKNLAKETNKTIIFSSHEIDMAIQLCDKLLVMSENGSQLATPDEHIKDGNFDKLFPPDLISFDHESKAFRVNK